MRTILRPDEDGVWGFRVQTINVASTAKFSAHVLINGKTLFHAAFTGNATNTGDYPTAGTEPVSTHLTKGETYFLDFIAGTEDSCVTKFKVSKPSISHYEESFNNARFIPY
jgi:hypothetical protein